MSIKKHFAQIYASEYHFNRYGVATFPKLLITDTSKTQFLFRINKGIENVWDTDAINRWMHDDERELPFERIDDSLFHAPGVVSRKRQIFPAVCEAIQQAE